MEPALSDLGARLNQGSTDALEECYRTLAPLVRAYVTRYVSASEADDVVQQVFFEVWRHHARYDPNRSLRAFVLDIARKRAIDHLRKRRDTVVPIESMRDIAGDDGRDHVERLMWADEVRTALQQLPEPQREVIALAYFAGHTQSEIATRLDIPLGTVKTRTTRALQRLAGLLEHTRDLP